MEETAMMRVYPGDRVRLTEMFGKPTQKALAKLLETNCPHPEEQRGYITADLPVLRAVDGAASPLVSTVQRAGFFCAACRMYVFPDGAHG